MGSRTAKESHVIPYEAQCRTLDTAPMPRLCQDQTKPLESARHSLPRHLLARRSLALLGPSGPPSSSLSLSLAVLLPLYLYSVASPC